MANFIIKNEMSSMLDLSAIKDIHGNPVSLRPSGGPGASREITEQASQHDAVTRVVDAKWASLSAISPEVSAPFVPPPAPPEPVPDVVASTEETNRAASGMAAVTPEPAAETPSEPVAEPVAETSSEPVAEPAAEPAAETPAEAATEAPVAEEKPASVDAPTLGGRPSNRRR